MEIKTKNYRAQTGVISPNGRNTKADVILANHLTNTPPDKIAGLTRLPLDQIRPLSFTHVFAEEVRELCRLAIVSQDAYSKNWELWHSDKTDMPGIGKRIPPLGKGKFDFGEVELITTRGNPEYKIPTKKDIAEYQYMQQYYLHRRSTTPDYTMGLIELASRQMESRLPDEEGAPVVRLQ